jgi:hypothetical protein
MTTSTDRIINCCIDSLVAQLRDFSADAIIEMIDDCDSNDKGVLPLLNAIDDALATDAITARELRDRICIAQSHLDD